jgi:isocitrate/isopropylmalate dehydrogenase
VALLLRHGLGLAEPAGAVERAISLALEQGARTRDIAEPEAPALGTREMGSRIAGLVSSPPVPLSVRRGGTPTVPPLPKGEGVRG